MIQRNSHLFFFKGNFIFFIHLFIHSFIFIYLFIYLFMAVLGLRCYTGFL